MRIFCFLYSRFVTHNKFNVCYLQLAANEKKIETEFQAPSTSCISNISRSHNDTVFFALDLSTHEKVDPELTAVDATAVIDLSVRDENGMTALHMAARDGDVHRLAWPLAVAAGDIHAVDKVLVMPHLLTHCRI